MPVEVINYKAYDGSIWPSLHKATVREKLLDVCEIASSMIGKKPTLGHGSFKQHKVEDCIAFRSALLKIVKRYMGSDWNEEWDSLPEEEVSAFGIIGRILSDRSDLHPLYSLWCRWSCIDKKGREWDQPYFAIQSDKGTV